MSRDSHHAAREGRAAAPGAPLKPVQDLVLLLKRTPYGESSLVVHGLSSLHGRVEIIARGAHRPKSRFSGVLDWFDTLELDWQPPREVATGRTETARISSLGTLRAGDVSVRRRWITSSLEAYRAAHTALELVELSTRAGFADLELYRLLETTLDEFNGVGRAALDGADAAEPSFLALRLARFELRLLQTLGLEPSLKVCAACGEPAPPVAGSASASPSESGPGEPRAPFAPHAGGRLCARHAAESHAAGLRVGTLPVDVLEAAHALAHGGKNGLAAASEGHTPQFGERILDFASRFLDHQLETRPKSHAEFLGAPDRNRRARPPEP